MAARLSITHRIFEKSQRISRSEELYVAVRAPLGVARVSLPTRELEAVFERARRDVVLAGAIAFFSLSFLACSFSRSVSRPIVELRDVARAIADGDIDRAPPLLHRRVGDLATALHRLSEQLSARLNSLQSQRALLSAIVESLEKGHSVDSASQVVEVNDAAATLLGVRAPFHFRGSSARHGALRDSLPTLCVDRPATPLNSATAIARSRSPLVLFLAAGVLALRDLT